MFSRTTLIAALVVVAQARFNREQIPIPAIAAVKGGDPGEAATIAGAAVSDLLGAANACAKLVRADQIIAELGDGADAVAAAIGMVTAEKNFNNFATPIPTICNDPTLPVTEVLRGITPLIDPGVGGSDVANALSKSSAATPLDATGKSIADLLTENGFTNFTGQAADGAADATPVAASSAVSSAAPVASSATIVDCGAAPAASVTTSAAAVEPSAPAATATAAPAAGGNAGGVEQSSIAGLDFGLCVPTIKFEGGLGGRPATEFTFQMIDPLAAEGQQEALNPNIITNRMCDQLTNVCDANDAAKTACDAAKQQILDLGTRDKSTADTWNTLLGFAGTVTNPDGGDAEPPAAARRAVRFAA